MHAFFGSDFCLFDFFDKTLLFHGGNIWRPFWIVKKYFASKTGSWRCDLGVNIGIPGIFGVAEDRVSVCLRLKIVGGPFLGTPFDQLTAGIMLFGGTPFGKLTAGIVSPL